MPTRRPFRSTGLACSFRRPRSGPNACFRLFIAIPEIRFVSKFRSNYKQTNRAPAECPIHSQSHREWVGYHRLQHRNAQDPAASPHPRPRRNLRTAAAVDMAAVCPIHSQSHREWVGYHRLQHRNAQTPAASPHPRPRRNSRTTTGVDMVAYEAPLGCAQGAI